MVDRWLSESESPMSNCIQISEATYCVGFTPEDIDVDALRKYIATEEKDRDSMSYWFLSTNVEFLDNGDVAIAFGEGRSTHTLRDFEGIIRIIGQFMRKESYHTFNLLEIENRAIGWWLCKVRFAKSVFLCLSEWCC